MTHVLGLVPARGGSKGVPGKNVRPLAGRTLLDYAAAATVTHGTPVNSTLNPATETDLYKFTVAVPNSRALPSRSPPTRSHERAVNSSTGRQMYTTR